MADDQATQRLPVMEPPPNTRANPRIDTNTLATVSRGQKKVPFRIDNLSAGGARLIGPLALQKGQHVEITFQLETNTFTLMAEVVRVETPDLLTDQIAVQFVDVTAEAKVAINDLVMRRLHERSEDDDDAVVVEQPEP